MNLYILSFSYIVFTVLIIIIDFVIVSEKSRYIFIYKFEIIKLDIMTVFFF